MPVYKKIYFLHIPKTAGSTFHHILFRQYTHHKHAMILNVPRTQKYLNLSDRKKSNTQVVRGHFLFGLHRRKNDEGLCLTFLREPLMRTISGHEYIYRNKKHAFHKQMTEGNYSLYEFLEKGMVKNFDNTQVRFLCGDNDMPFGAVNQTHLEQAWQNLTSNDMMFGLTDKFDESVLYFAHLLDWNMPYYERMNVTRERKTDLATLDPKTLEKLCEVNQYDLELYKRAQALFTERIQALGPGFVEKLKQFKEANGHYKTPKYNLFQKLQNVLRVRLLFR